LRFHHQHLHWYSGRRNRSTILAFFAAASQSSRRVKGRQHQHVSGQNGELGEGL
jgi:hypothetical protein